MSGSDLGRCGRDQWLSIEMRHLAALAAVAQEASFGRAADRLGYGQSAISRQIAYLERVVGRKLCERSGQPRAVTLTEAGAALVDRVGPILTQLRLAQTEIDAIGASPTYPARLGIASIFGPWVATTLVEAMMREGADAASGRLQRGRGARLREAVGAGQLDAAFVALGVRTGPLLAAELLREPYVLVSPGRPRSADLALERWPLVTIEDCRATRALQVARDAERVHSAESPASALLLVRADAAAAVVTRRDLAPNDRALATFPMPALGDRVLGLVWHRDRDDCCAIGALRTIALQVLASSAGEPLAPAPTA